MVRCVALFLAVVVAASYAQEDKAALEPSLNKKYKLVHSENFEEVLEELGVRWVIRRLANAARPVIELTEDDGEYCLSSKSAFRNTSVHFRIGQEFTEETLDGRTVKSKITQKGNVITHVQSGAKTTTITRTFTPEEVMMVITVGDVTSTRIYKPE